MPIVLVGTKKDLRLDPERLAVLAKANFEVVTTEQGRDVAEKIGAVAYVECSAKMKVVSLRNFYKHKVVFFIDSFIKISIFRGFEKYLNLQLEPPS